MKAMTWVLAILAAAALLGAGTTKDTTKADKKPAATKPATSPAPAATKPAPAPAAGATPTMTITPVASPVPGAPPTLTVTPAAPGAAPAPTGPTGPCGVVDIKERSWDAGKVERGAPISHAFVLKNTGKYDLTVDAKPG